MLEQLCGTRFITFSGSPNRQAGVDVLDKHKYIDAHLGLHLQAVAPNCVLSVIAVQHLETVLKKLMLIFVSVTPYLTHP